MYLLVIAFTKPFKYIISFTPHSNPVTSAIINPIYIRGN